MIEKKIEEAQEEIYEDRFLFNGEDIHFDNDDDEEMYYSGQIKEAIKLGANWALEQFLNDLRHPAEEIPRNDNGKIFAFSKVNRNIKLYDMNDSLDETICGTYKEMWENEVKTYSFTDWVFIEDLIDLINKIV